MVLSDATATDAIAPRFPRQGLSSVTELQFAGDLRRCTSVGGSASSAACERVRTITIPSLSVRGRGTTGCGSHDTTDLG